MRFERRVTVSKQKELILSIVEKSYSHPTAEDVLTEARQTMPHLALGTVYRNLQALVSEGRVRKIDMPQGGARYDRVEDDHAHFVCVECGAILDSKDSSTKSEIEVPEDVTVVGYELQIRCLCPSCAGRI